MMITTFDVTYSMKQEAISYCRGTARRSKTVDIWPTAAQLYKNWKGL